MKISLLIMMMAITSVATAQFGHTPFDPNSPAGLETKAKYDGYERDGEGLRASELSSELIRIATEKKSRMALQTKSEEKSSTAFITTDDDMRAISYAVVLEKRSDRGDPYASFFYGVHQGDFCSRLEPRQSDIEAKLAKECWRRILPAFKRASDAGVADASFNIAKLYENGFGVLPSKLVAAEWYVKSAEQYNKDKFRDEALIAVERAVGLVPDHPAALRLRKSMLK